MVMSLDHRNIFYCLVPGIECAFNEHFLDECVLQKLSDLKWLLTNPASYIHWEK